MVMLSYVIQLFSILSVSAACRTGDCVILTLGLSVVPLVYMMVHRSSGLGGMGSEGFSCPSFAKASKLKTFMPKASASCTACFHLKCSADECSCDCSGWCPHGISSAAGSMYVNPLVSNSLEACHCIRLVRPACKTIVA
jgi:hypothetical protein